MIFCYFFFFFKQKTAYEMRISDWSSDVCSSDLDGERSGGHAEQADIIAEAKMVDGKGHLCVHRIDGIGASLHAGRVWCAWQGRGVLRYDRAKGKRGGKDGC